MTYYVLSSIINTVVSLVLAFIVLLKGRDSIHRPFVYFSLSVAWWSIGYFFWQTSSTQEDAMFWIRFLMMGAILVPATYAHFIFSFFDMYIKKRRLLFTSYFITLLFEFFVFNNNFISKTKSILGFEFWPEPGIIFHIFLVLWAFYTIYVTKLIYKKYLTAKNDYRAQIKSLLIGLTLGFIGGATNYFLWYDILIPPIGNALVSLYVVFIFYAIARHKLFNIKVILAELLVFILWVTLGIQLFLADSLSDLMFEGVLFILVIVFGIFLIKNVSIEVKRREETEKLVKDLKIVNEKLKQLDEQKSEFISIASHQLRTPLTAIKGYTSMLFEGTYGELSTQVKSVIDKIFQSSQRLVYIVNDMLDVSRIEEGRLKYAFEDVKISSFVKDVIEELKVNADFKKLKFSFNVGSEDSEIIIIADHEKLRQAIINIIDNSIKYTDAGFVLVSLEKSKDGNSMILSIKDSGIGMAKDQFEAIFEKFERSKNAIKTHTEGSGLGLYVAKEIIKSNGGVIRATSKGLGRGSQFYIEFPIKKG